MDDKTVLDDVETLEIIQDLDDFDRLLPPRTTEYRSGSVLTLLHNHFEDPVTVPSLPTVQDG